MSEFIALDSFDCTLHPLLDIGMTAVPLACFPPFALEGGGLAAAGANADGATGPTDTTLWETVGGFPASLVLPQSFASTKGGRWAELFLEDQLRRTLLFSSLVSRIIVDG